ncbi:MAG: hypothetical protein AAGG68_27250 [Bacteroidota bacterium]
MKLILKVIGSLFLLVVITVIAIVAFVEIGSRKMRTITVDESSITSHSTIPFTISESGHILINISVDNSQTLYPFILDTGASSTFFNQKLSKNFTTIGRIPQVDINRTLQILKIVKTPQIRIGDIEIKDVAFKQLNLKNGSLGCVSKYAGIIGKELMRHFVWQIDFENEVIHIVASRDELTLTGDEKIIKLRENKGGHQLSIICNIPEYDKYIPLTLDTGLPKGVIIGNEQLYRFTDTTKIIPSRRYVGNVGVGLSGKISTDKKTLIAYYSEVKIGEKVKVDSFPIYINSTKSFNALGIDFLKNYKATISWKDKELLLLPIQTLAINANSFGLNIRYNNELQEARVEYIIEESAAERTGVLVQDKVISVNYIPITSQEDLCSSKWKDQDILELEVERNGKIYHYSLQKEPLF